MSDEERRGQGEGYGGETYVFIESGGLGLGELEATSEVWWPSGRGNVCSRAFSVARERWG
jgi:hypothetical protein